MDPTLFPHDTCQCCFHGPHEGYICTAMDEAPGEDGIVFSSCMCDEYVDFDMRGQRIVDVTPIVKDWIP
jgi:hypothetical protein